MHRLRCSDGWTKWAFIDGYPIGHDLRLRCVIQSGRTRVRSPSIEFPLQTKLEKTRNKSAVFRPHPSPTALMSQPWTTPWTRSEEHTSELQSLMRISYAVFCLKTKKTTNKIL